MKCTICLGSETLRAIKFKSVLEPELDLSVFIKPSATTDPVDVPVPSTGQSEEENPTVVSKSKGRKGNKKDKKHALRAPDPVDVPVPSTEEAKVAEGGGGQASGVSGPLGLPSMPVGVVVAVDSDKDES
jgi:hypothetical protein